jgi:hypothetical protein
MNKMKVLPMAMLLATTGFGIGWVPSAHAIGCLSGGVAGAVAGHMAHHGVLGAVGGCIAGHEYLKHERRQETENQREKTNPPQDDRNSQ